MKKSFIAISIAAMFLAACSNNQSKEHDHQDGTHQHEDGSTHKDHEEGEQAKQEEFSVADTTTKSVDTNQHHSHDGHEHPHKH